MQSQAKGDEKTPLDLSLYKGVGYKAAQSTLSKFLYFYAYTSMANALTSKDAKSLSTAMNLVVGYLAELFHLPLSLPLEVIITRMQTTKGDTKQSFFQLLQTMWDENNGQLAGFYKGFSAYFVLCLQPAIQFTAFEQVKKLYLKSKASSSLSAIEAFMLGAAARSLATLVVFPYIRAKVIMQAKAKAAAGDATPPETIPAILQRLVRDEGIGSLYRGLYPELTKGALSAAFMLMVKEKIEAYVTLSIMLTQMYMSS
ncbi:hypothetical protein SPRG_04081 [Saprolegnia parasitica CBS 223.65]|uniref:Uncharacterized protein n=1 Tax=Saprolegnia parasitica (strain CBS 223.65) TaxID=695850 RepID=A0A067CY48_SAPPC|nr:hypothetical protein SPRG_04081 [Saprolegnia parasitica CBS 223.65]KDO31466.1 hypothetical protein SPRG_04081 [Saprolegnia parasitica CBS 223.65]|eukprot:XP_012198059.1 hypothetical protein SPRG_04081 [Saprolegnia parasitica CBS 223.65]